MKRLGILPVYVGYGPNDAFEVSTQIAFIGVRLFGYALTLFFDTGAYGYEAIQWLWRTNQAIPKVPAGIYWTWFTPKKHISEGHALWKECNK